MLVPFEGFYFAYNQKMRRVRIEKKSLASEKNNKATFEISIWWENNFFLNIRARVTRDN